MPTLIEKLKKEYTLSHLIPLENLTYHYVLSGYQGTLPIILKIGLDISSMSKETAALEAFSEYGAVQILAEDEGLLLLERIIPGVPLKDYFPLKELEAMEVFSSVVKKLEQAPFPRHTTFPSVGDWLKKMDQEWNIPPFLLNKARLIRDFLLSTSSNLRLLHGDLHHDNILKGTEGWVVIDPKGVVGEIYYEAANFIRNPLPELVKHPHMVKIIQNRISQLSQTLKLDPPRLQSWCFVQGMLAWIWALEDGIDETPFQQCGEIFYQNFSLVIP